MKNKAPLAIMLTLLFVSFLAGIHVAEAQDTPKMFLSPTIVSAAPVTSFSVDVVLEDVANLVGWEFKLFWDNSILEGVTDVVHVPAGCNWEAPNNFELGPGIEQDHNATNGRYYKALVLLPEAEPHPTPFNGTTMLVTLTFSVKANGSCVLDLSDTKLADSDAYPLGHMIEDGYFLSQPIETNIQLRAIAAIVAAFGAKIGDPRWIPAADINLDGTIDIYDMVLIAGDFGETV